MNVKKIIIINMAILAILYLCTECFFYIKMNKRCGGNLPLTTLFNKTPDAYLSERFHPYDKTKNYTKKPVLMAGCSYTYGEELPPDDNVTSKLERLTNRHYYNWGVVGHGPIAQLPLFRKQEFDNIITEAPEYIIYTYMFHHPQRAWYWNFYNTLRKENLIPSQPYNFLYNSYIFQHIKNVEFDYLMDEKYADELLFKTFKRLKEKSEKLFPGSKFVVLVYSDVNKDLCEGIVNSSQPERIEYLFNMMNSEEFKKRLEDMGIKVIYTKELIGREMDRPEDRIPKERDINTPHPSSAAWDEILPPLINELNL